MSDRKYVLSADLPHASDKFLSIVLAEFDGKWVTWLHNKNTGGDSNGHYFKNEDAARKDWAERVQKSMDMYLGV